MASYTIVYPAMDVHAAGCADLGKRSRIHADQLVTLDGTLDEIIAHEVADFEADDMGYTAADFRILPCARRKIATGTDSRGQLDAELDR